MIPIQLESALRIIVNDVSAGAYVVGNRRDDAISN